MFKFRLKPKQSNFAEKVKSSDLNPEVKEIFIGRNTIFSLLAFIVGGILFGSSLWMYVKEYLGLPLTMLAGLFLFIIGGILAKAFRK